MFNNAQEMIENTRQNLERMSRAVHAIPFKADFSSFLGSCRAITYALQKQGIGVDGFKEWYAAKQDEMKNDERLRFIHTARTADLHEGRHCLHFSTRMDFVSGALLGPPPQEGAPFELSHEGLSWVVNVGTPQEQRIPITPPHGGMHSTSVAIDNPPRVHLGKNLACGDPVQIAFLALQYMEALVFEAVEKFSNAT